MERNAKIFLYVSIFVATICVTAVQAAEIEVYCHAIEGATSKFNFELKIIENGEPVTFLDTDSHVFVVKYVSSLGKTFTEEGSRETTFHNLSISIEKKGQGPNDFTFQTVGDVGSRVSLVTTKGTPILSFNCQ